MGTSGASPGTRRLLADELADRIQARILDGTYKPGDRLPAERELAEQLGANRGSIREALKKLEQLRLVDIQQGSGIRVCALEHASLELVLRLLVVDGRPNVPWIRDLMELREALVPPITRLALERARPDELSELATTLRQASDPEISEDERNEVVEHMADVFARMTHNQVLMLLSNSLRRFFERAPGALTGATRTLDANRWVPAVRLLAAAIEARDTESAVRVTSELIRQTNSEILALLEQIAGEAPQKVDPPSTSR